MTGILAKPANAAAGSCGIVSHTEGYGFGRTSLPSSSEVLAGNIVVNIARHGENPWHPDGNYYTNEVKNGFAKDFCFRNNDLTVQDTAVRVVDIRESCRRHLSDIGHPEDIHDIAYENVQARERTQVLMDVANMEGALVVGTGDLSEIALGWNTYNGDHMSMYQLNASIPKTMVLGALRLLAKESEEPLRPLLAGIAAAPITPELVPDAAANDSEARLGPYALHDFFLFHYLANGASADKLLALARIAFRDMHADETIVRTHKTFLHRFRTAQYKRNCVPDGPKITLSLSPRADWRMPSDLP